MKSAKPAWKIIGTAGIALIVGGSVAIASTNEENTGPATNTVAATEVTQKVSPASSAGTFEELYTIAGTLPDANTATVTKDATGSQNSEVTPTAATEVTGFNKAKTSQASVTAQIDAAIVRTLTPVENTIYTGEHITAWH